MDKIKKFEAMLSKANNIVAFTGAGVSTDSGIKDFRSNDGLYNILREKYNMSPEYMLSRRFFNENTEKFYEFYKSALNSLDAKPNITHEFLANLEKSGKLKAIVTQNIDGLHERAGALNVLNLHGSIFENFCLECGKSYSEEFIFYCSGVPRCSCGGLIKPHVVLYGEALSLELLEKASMAIREADMLIVLGTSLLVEPAASLIKEFKGKYLVIINRDKTPYDSRANLVINDNIKSVFEKLSLEVINE